MRRFVPTPPYWRCIAACALVLAIGSAGCVPASPAKRVAQALDSIATTVHAGMNTAGVLYREGKINDSQKAEILKRYAQYQEAMSVATHALRTLPPGTEPIDILTNVQRAAEHLLVLIGTFKE